MTRPQDVECKPGDQFGELVVISVGETTARVMCSCGYIFRCRTNRLRSRKRCRLCRRHPRKRNTKRPEPDPETHLTVRVTAQDLQRLCWLCEREGYDIQTALKIAIERLFWAFGA